MNAIRKPTFNEVITGNPNPIEATVIARAQSILTKDGKIGPVLSYDEAVEVIAQFEKQGPQK